MKTRSKIVMLVLVCLTVMLVNAAEEDTKKDVNEPQIVVQATAEKVEILKTETEKVSYIIGTQIAGNFKSQNIEVNLDSLLMGLKDALEGKKLVLSQDVMKQVYSSWQQKMRAKQAAKQAKEAAENIAAGTAFLEANKAKEGVKVLPSGLQYKVITEGTGNTPTADDKVKTHYRGTLINGTEFDSSYKRNQPAEFPVKGVIKGWTEALQLMKEGGKWELYIPANLAYGERGRPSIPANSTLIFEIELLEIVKVDPAAKAKAAQPTIQVK
ncbi:FKBP-type peptidyl-prolyl cis-trans isomerase [Planctomycetota bacterium]